MKKIIFSLLIALLVQINVKAQNLNSTLIQDNKISNILDEKRKINSKITINDTYKIQIYHGNAEGAKKILSDFNSHFNAQDAAIIFVTPNYKVWVGSYKSRIEANKALNEIRKIFDRALIIKPNK